MTLKEFKSSLENRNELSFIIENGMKIPAYFHITEMGSKNQTFYGLWWSNEKRF